ncbi:MAG: response regulator transcription factor [Oscillospiraceae bacterium]|nr:response regulator transcription factor [Oscillospiraceae bacterium]
MGNQPCILIADDEKEIITVLKLFLEKENIRVIEAYDGQAAYEIMKRNEIDLAIVDIMMPRMNGYELMKKLQHEFDIPVIILSAKDKLDDRVLGLELGADDYITKPFEPLEVTARIKAHLRRLAKHHTDDQFTIRFEDMRLDTEKCMLFVGTEEINLTKIELALMEMFMCNPGKVFTREQIFQAGWNDTTIVDDNTIRVTISRLRDKIGSDRIKTIRGLGYRLEVSR